MPVAPVQVARREIAGRDNVSAHRQSADMGVAVDRLVVVELDLPRDRYSEPAARRAVHDDLVQRIGAAAGVVP